MAATALFLWSAREGMMGSSSSSLPEEEVEVEVEVEEPQLIMPDHDRHQRQLEPRPDEPTIVKGNDQDHDHHSRQQIIRPRNPTSKKKRKKGAAAEQKNKQPQRGLGVAQLEKLRLQERWKKITEIEGIHNTAATTGLLLPSASSSSTSSFQFQQFPPALYGCCRSGGAGSSTTSLGLYGMPWSEACFLQKHMTTYSNAAAVKLQHIVEEEDDVDRNVVTNGSMLLPAAGYHNYQMYSSSYNSPGIGIGMNGVVVPSAELSSNQNLLLQYCALPSSTSSHSCYFCLKQENGTSMLGGSSSGESLQAYVGSNDLFYVQRFNNIATHADGNGQKEMVQGGFHDDDLRRRMRCEKEASSEVEEYQLFPCTNGVNTSGFSAGGDRLSSTVSAGAASPTSFIDLTLKLSYS